MKILAIFFLMFIFKGALSQPCPSPLVTYVYYNEDNTIHFTATPGFDSYLWIPSEDFPDPTISDPIIPYVGTDEYTLITTWVGPELVLNSDFSLGNTEFLSDLNYSIIYTPGNYYVGNTFFATPYAEDDHSPSADGMFMSVDGSYMIETLWEQTITDIEENTDYQFSFWATAGGTINPPNYEIHLIGDVTGDEIIATLDGYTDTAYWYWVNYLTPLWNSGMNNTVTVRIINLETNGYGNDFGLDDFSFRNVCIDTTKINISTTISILSNNVSCFGACDGTAEVEYEGDSFYTYLWDEAAGGGVESSVTGLCPGTYSVSITDEFGFVVILYATITEPPPLLLSEFGYNPAFCRMFDYQSGNGEVFGAATGGTPDYTYKWTNLETGDWVSNTTWGGLNPGTYEFTVTDKNGCVLTQLIEVDSLNPIADFTITLDQLKTDCDAVIPVDIMFTNNSLNYANPNDPFADTTFFWNFNHDNIPWQISNDIDEQFIINYALSGTYEVCLVAINKNGCKDTTCKTLILCDPTVFVPINIFTPNEDGKNDVFTFSYKSDAIKEFYCVIVDRWGVTIAEFYSISQGWDGKDKQGNYVTDGVYFYKYIGKEDTGKELVGQGTVQVIKG